MSKRKVYYPTIIAVFIGVFGFLFYKDNYSDEGILDNVINRKGYNLNQVEENVAVELFIKPEWIPFNGDAEKELDIKLIEENSTNIVLDNVRNRSNDYYFSLTTTYNMDREEGTFMYIGTFNEDGSFTTHSSPYDFNLYNKNGEKIVVGQTGYGPNSDFSFGIDNTPENYNLIKDGFYVKFSGFILYEYFRN